MAQFREAFLSIAAHRVRERHAATANAKRFARTSHADHRDGTGNILLRDPVKWAPRSFFIPAGVSDQGGGYAVDHESPLLARCHAQIGPIRRRRVSRGRLAIRRAQNTDPTSVSHSLLDHARAGKRGNPFARTARSELEDSEARGSSSRSAPRKPFPSRFCSPQKSLLALVCRPNLRLVDVREHGTTQDGEHNANINYSESLQLRSAHAVRGLLVYLAQSSISLTKKPTPSPQPPPLIQFF